MRQGMVYKVPVKEVLWTDGKEEDERSLLLDWQTGEASPWPWLGRISVKIPGCPFIEQNLFVQTQKRPSEAKDVYRARTRR